LSLSASLLAISVLPEAGGPQNTSIIFTKIQ
jgi:hypothetical protein